MSTSDLQQRLTELGYKPGPVDGLMGPKTVAALKRYQRDQKLRPTGILDRETISRLQKRTP